MEWSRQTSRPKGGYWRCVIARREQQRAAYAADPDRFRTKSRRTYDHNWRYRIQKRLRQNERDRRTTLEARRQRMKEAA